MSVCAALSDVPDVELDQLEDGETITKFKYIQIKVENAEASKLIVRGYKDCEYHADIFSKVEDKINSSGNLKMSCPGGGRIQRKIAEEGSGFSEHVTVYGYSVAFGRPRHQDAVDILEQFYSKNGKSMKVDWSNDGY